MSSCKWPIGLLCFFLSLALALSLLSTPMKTLKLSRKKESAPFYYFLSLKVRAAVRFTAETRGYLKCKISLKFSRFVFGRTKGATHATIQSQAIYVLITLFTFQKFLPHCFRLLSILQRYQFVLPCPATFTVNFSYYLAL